MVFMVASPSLNSSPSAAIIASNLGFAFGPKIIEAFVNFERDRWPLTKSAWKWVSNMYLIVALLSSFKLKILIILY